MKKILIATAVFLLSGLCFAEGESELIDATDFGDRLYSAVMNNEEIEYTAVSNGDALKKYLNDYGCPGYDYNLYLISADDKTTLYVIGQSESDFIVGRHFKGAFEEGKVLIETMSSSTKTCLNLGAPGENVASLMTTHLGDYPNEFHALQTKLRGISLYVGAKKGIYSLENGRIRLVQAR